MLELRLTADAKRIAAMGEAIRRECSRAHTSPAHAESVALVAAQLVAGDAAVATRRRRGERSPEVLVIVTVQSDVTLLMVRETRPADAALAEGRRALLDAGTARWSMVSGPEDRTIWAEIERTAAPEPVPGAAAVVARLRVGPNSTENCLRVAIAAP
jgi:hypothetical protein